MSGRPQVLVITHRFVYPPDRGDRIRTWHVVDQLLQYCDVSLACLTDEPIHLADWDFVFNRVKRLAIQPAPRGGAVAGLARSLLNGRSVTENSFYSPGLHQTLQEWAADTQFDVALAFCSSTARYLEGLAVPHQVVDLIDVDSCKWAQYADLSAGLRRLVYRRESHKLAEYEQELANQHDLVVTCEREAQTLRNIAPGARITVARNGVDSEPAPTPAGECDPTVVFTGVLDYKPNVEGLAWFVNQVWPQVIAAVPHARFDVVGRGAGRAVARLANAPGVRLVGAVPEVEPYLNEARIAVAPLHIARGVQNKALQAMAAGRPVVATPQVRDGLTVNGRCPCIAAESAEQWAQTLVALLSHDALASSFGTRGRLFVDLHYQWASTLMPLLADLIPNVPANSTIPLIPNPTRAAA